MWLWACHCWFRGKHEAVAHVFWWRERPPDDRVCGASSLFVFPSTHHGPANYICDATAVSKCFRHLRAGHDIVSRGNQDLWTAIQGASAQRDITVQWIASHEENTMHCVDATTAWFIGLDTLADLVDLEAPSEHEVCESGNSLTCCRSGQKAPRRLLSSAGCNRPVLSDTAV